MWNEPTRRQLAALPGLYATEEAPVEDKTILMHFFLAGSDWYIVEYDGEDLFFGFTVLNGDTFNAEWGYISFSELKKIWIKPGLEVERDLHWRPQPFSEVLELINN